MQRIFLFLNGAVNSVMEGEAEVVLKEKEECQLISVNGLCIPFGREINEYAMFAIRAFDPPHDVMAAEVDSPAILYAGVKENCIFTSIHALYKLELDKVLLKDDEVRFDLYAHNFYRTEREHEERAFLGNVVLNEATGCITNGKGKEYYFSTKEADY